ncbi:winged helix DNA-binding domain-containing protein [Streptomyces sp. NPDC048639]|uniref:winged helix DNA-binding domain-containing protein n=1 Tax=Streptomyces sp. NPDC048639 TaxID=3365581 RepID=UPI003710E480
MEGNRADRMLRARAQLLGGGIRETTVAGVLARVLAVQAQDLTAAGLGLRVRARGLTAADVARATDAERTAVRGWYLRGTLQLVPAADARWLLALFGPVFLRLAARRFRELGLDEALCERAERLIATAVDAEGPLTRAELTDRLTTLGVDPTGQSAYHLIRRAALSGRICHGPERAGEATFVLLDDWLPATGPLPWQGEAAEAELARRYLAAYAPASVQDFAHWSGLRLAVCRRAWESVTAREPEPGPPGRPGDTDPGATELRGAGPDVRLIPAFDNYLVGYRSRELSVPAEHERTVRPGGGLIRPTVLADGWAVGTWTAPTARHSAVRVEPFGGDTGESALPPEALKGMEAEVADIARYFGTEES